MLTICLLPFYIFKWMPCHLETIFHIFCIFHSQADIDAGISVSLAALLWSTRSRKSPSVSPLGALHGLGDAKAESPSLEHPVQRGWLRSFQVAVQTTFTLWQTAFWFNGLMKTKDGQDGQSANLRAKNRHKMMCCMSTAGWSGAPSHSSKGSPYIFAFCMFARGCFVEGTVIILWSYYVALCCTRQYGYCVLYCVSSVSRINLQCLCRHFARMQFECSLSTAMMVWKIYHEKPQNLATDWAEFQPAFLYLSMLNEI